MSTDKLILMDLDGTLYPWIPCGEWEKPGYYFGLQVVQTMRELARRLKDEPGVEFKFCTCYPSPHAYEEKKAALRRDFGFLRDDEIILVPYGQNKFDYVETEGRVTCLIDDYSPNLRDAEAKGVIGIKAMNGLNGTKGTWEGSRISIYDTAEKNAERILKILAKGGLIHEREKGIARETGRDGR